MGKNAAAKGKKGGQKTMVKVVIPFKSPKTNAYKYKEKMVTAEEAKALLK